MMDIKISIALKDKTYGFSDLLNGRELNNQTKQEVIDLIKEDIGYVFDQQIEVEQLHLDAVSHRRELLTQFAVFMANNIESGKTPASLVNDFYETLGQ